MEWGEWGEKHLDFILNPIEKDARINVLEGSVRSGKTVAMIPKWIDYIQNGSLGLLLMVGVSKETLYDNVLNDLFNVLGERNYSYNRQSGDLTVYWIIKNKDGSIKQKKRRIKVIGAKDEGSEKYLRGKTLAGAYCDEITLMPEKFFKQLLNRLSIRGAKLYATTNPDTPFHYLYEEYIQEGCERRKSGMVKVIHFNLDDNPNLDDEYKGFIRSAYAGLWYKRMILGMWVMADGAVYDMWSDEENIFTDEDIPPGTWLKCQRYIAIDYGVQNPTTFIDLWDNGKTIWIRKEYYYSSRSEEHGGRQKTNKQYADDLEKFIGEDWPAGIIIDPSAASFILEVKNKGIGRVIDANNEVLDGIRKVSSFLQQRKIRVHRSCKMTIQEFNSYAWDDKARRQGKDEPLKQNDHCMDPIRYYVNTLRK